MNRCSWSGNDALMTAYYDEEWGVPRYAPRMPSCTRRCFRRDEV